MTDWALKPIQLPTYLPWLWKRVYGLTILVKLGTEWKPVCTCVVWRETKTPTTTNNNNVSSKVCFCNPRANERSKPQHSSTCSVCVKSDIGSLQVPPPPCITSFHDSVLFRSLTTLTLREKWPAYVVTGISLFWQLSLLSLFFSIVCLRHHSYMHTMLERVLSLCECAFVLFLMFVAPYRP